MGNIVLNFNISTSAVFRPVIVADFLHGNNTFGATANHLLIGKTVYVDAERYDPDPERQTYLNSEDARYWRFFQLSDKNIEDLTFSKPAMLNGKPVILPDGTTQTEQVLVIDHLKKGKYSIQNFITFPLTYVVQSSVDAL